MVASRSQFKTTSGIEKEFSTTKQKNHISIDYYSFLSILCSYFNINEADKKDCVYLLKEIEPEYQNLFPGITVENLVFAVVLYQNEFMSYTVNERLFDLEFYLTQMYGTEEVSINGKKVPKWYKEFLTIVWCKTELQFIF